MDRKPKRQFKYPKPRLRDSLDQATLDKLYGLKRRLERGNISKSINKGDQSYVKGQEQASGRTSSSGNA
jgi:hypothetical protein